MSFENFKVYVSCMTYNQAQYIKETLDGFCMQETTFPFLCAIFDDASIDNEPQIIQQYIEVNFDLNNKGIVLKDETDDYIRVFAQHKTNKNCFFAILFLKYNHHQLRKVKDQYMAKWSENAKYRAICEGDDYWIDPLKLQKQVDFLDAHSDYALVYTQCKYFDQETNKLSLGQSIPYKGFKHGLLYGLSIATLTVMIRTDVFNKYYKEINPVQYKWSMSDYPLWLYVAANYNLYFLPDVTSVYRKHRGSVSRPIDFEKKKRYLQDHVKVQLFYAEKYNMPKDVFDTIGYRANYKMAIEHIEVRRYKEALPYIRQLSFKDKCKCYMHIVLKTIK